MRESTRSASEASARRRRSSPSWASSTSRSIALDGLGGDLLLAVAGLERLARLGDLLGQPLLALLEQPADLGDLGGELGRHRGVHLRGLAAGLGDLVGELLLALRERARVSANWASSAAPRSSKLARTASSASSSEPCSCSASDGGAQLVALGAQRLDVGGRGLLLGGAQLGELGACGGGLLAGGGGVGAQLLGQLAHGVEPLGGLGALARQLLEAAAVVAGQPLGLGLLDL